MEAETSWTAKYGTGNVNQLAHMVTPIKNTHWTFSSANGDEWKQSSNGNDNKFTQVLGTRPDFRIGTELSASANTIMYDTSLANQYMDWAKTEMHVSYDPSNPASKAINTMKLRLEMDEVRAAGGSAYDYSRRVYEIILSDGFTNTIEASAGAVVTQCHKSSACTGDRDSKYRPGKLRFAIDGTARRLFIVSDVYDYYLDGNVAKKIRNNNFRNNYDLKITDTNGVVQTISKADITKSTTRYFYDMSKQYTSGNEAAGGRGRFLEVKFRLITVGRWNKNKVEMFVSDEHSGDYVNFRSDATNKRTDPPRHRYHNRKKFFPAANTYGADTRNAAIRNNPYACENGWTLLPNSVW